MRWDWLQVAIYDDAFYYFAIAKTFVQTGMVSADGITLTNGFHPLWLITVLPIWLLGLPDLVTPLRLVMVQAAVFDTLAAYLIFRILLQYGQKVALWGTGLYFLNPAVLAQSMSGMETPLVAVLMVLWIYIIARHKKLLIYGIVGGLLCLARTDMVFLVIAGYIYTWWIDRKIPFRALIITSLVVSPWLAWNYFTLGTIFQSSGSAYPWIFKDEFVSWFNHSYLSKEMLWKLGDLGASSLQLAGAYFGGTIVFVALIAYLSKHFRSFDFKWALYGIAAVIFAHAFIRWFPRIWYFHTLYIVILLMVVPFFVGLSQRARICWLTVSLIGMIFVMGKIDGSSGVFARAYTTQRRAMVATEIIKCLPRGSTVGAWNSGYPQYFAPDSVTVINLDGLANNEVINYYRDRRFMEYCDMRNISFIVDNNFFMEWSFGKYFEPDQRSRIKRISRIENIARNGNDMCLFRIEPEELANGANQDER